MSRHDVTRRVAPLDPERHHVQIAHYLAGWEMPGDFIRALEMALYRTFCVPTTSAVLVGSGEFEKRPQRRYDDTSLLMAEIMDWGYDSDRGKQAIERINRFHGHYKIANVDFLYLLSTFHLQPIRWMARFGWRPFTETERHASYYFWREVGARMNIRDILASHAAFEAFSIAHEREKFRYPRGQRRIATATRELFVGWAPRPVRPIVRVAIHSMLDDAMREAFGLPRAPNAVRIAVASSLRARGCWRCGSSRRTRERTSHRQATAVVAGWVSARQAGPAAATPAGGARAIRSGLTRR